MKKRIFALLLASLMLASMVACEKEESPDVGSQETEDTSTPDVSGDATEVETEVETEDPKTLDDLPQKMDFDGLTLGVVCKGNDGGGYDPILGSDDTEASVMDQAKYERDVYLNERLGLDITESYFHYQNMANKTRALVMADDQTVDMVYWGMWRVFMFGVDGCLLPVSQVSNIDQSKAYWAEDVRDSMTLLGQQYALAGDFDTSRYAGCNCILFNKTILENHNLNNPYEMVANNQWTFDSLLNLATTVNNDADGDGTPTPGDTIGMVGQMATYFQNFHTAAGLRQVVSDENGYPVFNVPGNEKFVDVWNWCRGTVDSGVMMGVAGSMEFSVDRALFWVTSFGRINDLREMESDFGVVPIPKWDDKQENYHTPSDSNAFGVLVTAKSPEAVGAYLEMGSSYGHRNLIPLFYDNDLKVKLARDEECQKMFDLILASSTYDLGINAYQGTVNQELRMGFTDGKEMVSYVEQIRQKIDTALSDYVKIMQENAAASN